MSMAFGNLGEVHVVGNSGVIVRHLCLLLSLLSTRQHIHYSVLLPENLSVASAGKLLYLTNVVCHSLQLSHSIQRTLSPRPQGRRNS